MGEKSFPFNSVSGDRKYKAEDFVEYFAQLIGTGIVYASTDALKLKEESGMTVTLNTGGAFIKGRGYINNTNLTFALDTADGVLSRIDRVVISCNYSNRIITAKIKKGSYSKQPVAQSLQRDTDVYEIAIADVYVEKGAISITQSAITDLRLNTELCGVVTGLIEQADTTEIFNQFSTYLSEFKEVYKADIESWATTQQTEFTEWVESIKNVLNESAAGNLQAEIDKLNNDLENQKLLVNGFVASTTVFNTDGSITETSNIGTMVTTFNQDGSITKVLTKTDSSKVTQTTTFNQDGSISEVIS